MPAKHAHDAFAPPFVIMLRIHCCAPTIDNPPSLLLGVRADGGQRLHDSLPTERTSGMDKTSPSKKFLPER